MKPFIVLALALTLCGCGKPKYEYETFDWPKTSEAAKVIWYTVADETTTNATPQWSEWMPLQRVLDRAQDFDWQYVGAMGKTCILRRPARSTPTDPTALTS